MCRAGQMRRAGQKCKDTSVGRDKYVVMGGPGNLQVLFAQGLVAKTWKTLGNAFWNRPSKSTQTKMQNMRDTDYLTPKYKSYSPFVTSESQGESTCGSLGDVKWSHGTHDVRDLSGRSDRSRMRKPQQGGQNCIVMSVHVYEGFFTTMASNK